MVESGPQNGIYKPQNAYGKGTNIVRIDDFRNGKIKPWSHLRRLQLTNKEISLYGLRESELIVNRVNSMAHLGKSAVVKNLSEPCVFESNMMRVCLDKSNLNPDYLQYYLGSEAGLKKLRENAKQAVNQASINQTDVLEVEVPICPIKEQDQIVIQLEAHLSEADNLDKTLDAAIAQSESLRPMDPTHQPA
jgi:type I restriction enzyme S subunit